MQFLCNIHNFFFKHMFRHPDKNRDDPTANERFMKINEAYEVGIQNLFQPLI